MRPFIISIRNDQPRQHSIPPPKSPLRYTISETSLETRRKNILLSVVLSTILAVVAGAGHVQDPETYNDLIFWPVIAAVVAGNLVNYLRYRRYLRLIAEQRIEIDGDEVCFFTGADQSILDTGDLVALTFYRRKGQAEHIQLKLKKYPGHTPGRLRRPGAVGSRYRGSDLCGTGVRQNSMNCTYAAVATLRGRDTGMRSPMPQGVVDRYNTVDFGHTSQFSVADTSAQLCRA